VFNRAYMPPRLISGLRTCKTVLVTEVMARTFAMLHATHRRSANEINQPKFTSQHTRNGNAIGRDAMAHHGAWILVFLDPEGGSQNVTLVVLRVLGISSLKFPKV